MCIGENLSMRVFLNVSVVLVCGALAGLSSLVRSAPTQAANLPAPSSAASRLVAFDPQGAAVTAGRHGGSIEAHFAVANTTHDGHLTQFQAEQANWPRVARHFSEIDADQKGWISVEQIHAFNKSHHARRKASPT